MEKMNAPGKSTSFSNNGSPTTRLFITSSIRKKDMDRISFDGEDDSSSNDVSEHIDQLFRDFDQFVEVLTTADRNSSPPDAPDAVECLCKMIETRIAVYVSGENRNKFYEMTKEDESFIDAVMRLSKLSNAYSEFPAGSTAVMSRVGKVLQRAMAFMEEELPNLLEDSKNTANFKVGKSHSFNNAAKDDDAISGGNESAGEDKCLEYPPEVVKTINRIATAMIESGYANEFCQVYSISRRNAFSDQMKRFNFEKNNAAEDVQRMPWDTLEGEITRWIGMVKYCSKTLFPAERKLADSVLSDHPLFSPIAFSNLARPAVIQFVAFAEAVAKTKRSAEKLFKFLDMYETIRDLIPAISESCSDDCRNDIKLQISAAGDKIGEAVVSVFSDLENSIRNDMARTPVPGGAVHPLTRYVMNYLEYAFEYKDTLDHIFDHHNNNNNPSSPAATDPDTTPFSTEVVAVMDLLDANLQTKSMLYRDPSLRDIFLMNNGRYILQKVKKSPKMHKLMGDNWCRRTSGIVRQFHKNYQRETWGRVLRILCHEGIQVNGKIAKPVLKERFKSFTTAFEEIHRTQSTWVVSDEQLRSELQISISAVIIPAYRSFLGRFRQCLENSKQAERYIKYQPEDIEAMIEGLFEGNNASMARRWT